MDFFKRNNSVDKNEDINQEIEEFPHEIYDFLKELEKSDSHPIYFALEGFSQLKNEAKNVCSPNLAR